jgi:UDP-3-O-acyl N-acetylglucosamine deacetylase
VKSLPRRTLASPVEFSGIGVFSGGGTVVRLIPAEEPNGIIFVVGDTFIPLAIENVLDLPNRTALAANESRVEVVEHLLACLHIAGVTDLIIECPAGEVPLLDGSALPIWRVIEKGGLKDIPGYIAPLVAHSPVYVEGDEAVLIALPADELRVSYFLAYDDPRIGCEHTSLIISEETFAGEIVPARSFIEAERVQRLVEDGVVKSTDASQALVVYPDGVRGAFRVEKEFAKHKILDLIGDLYLTGRPVHGHFIGLRSGHGLNREMIRKIITM